MNQPEVKLHVLPGGIMPKRQTEGAIGYDVHLRAIVSPFDMDPEQPLLRKSLFDFRSMPENPTIAGHVLTQMNEVVYRMAPGESVLVGIGFVCEMPFPMFYWVAPRSGLASKWGITVTNAPGIVDPDYRGEAGVLVYNRADNHFDLRWGMRIAQVIFQTATIPNFTEISSMSELLETKRGVGGFGSTGLK